MKYLAGVIILLLLLACGGKDSVLVRGRIENGDTIASLWLKDSVYTFRLDQNGFFSGKINLKKGAYASFLANSLDIYLCPGEDLEIYVNLSNITGSLNYSGSLGGINNYLKEQEMAVFFDEDYYNLTEEKFVLKIEELINEQTKLLKAKNFDTYFTSLEEERLRYVVANYLLIYPIYWKLNTAEKYRPGKLFTDFLATFSLCDHDLFVTHDYRKFLLNYVYFQKGAPGDESYLKDLTSYILAHFKQPEIRNFLLFEIVNRYVWDDGLNGAEHFIEAFKPEYSDPLCWDTWVYPYKSGRICCKY